MTIRWLGGIAALLLLVPACTQSQPVANSKTSVVARKAETPADAPSTSTEPTKDAADPADADASETPSADATADSKQNEDEAAPAPNAGEQLLAAVADSKKPVHSFVFEMNDKLDAGGGDAERIAGELLGVTRQAVDDEAVANYIDEAAKETPIPAAKLLVWVIRAQQTAKMYGKGPYAVGRLLVADGKYPVTDVMAQVPITAEGYFATEIGDPSQPIAFRAPGYECLDVPLAPKSDEGTDEAKDHAKDAKTTAAFVLGDVTLEPLAPEHRATFRGKVVADEASKTGSIHLTMGSTVSRINTPSHGYSPRKSWPQPTEIDVDDSGAFEVEGVTPMDYYVSISADDHTPKNQRVELKPGETTDLGEIRLRTTNLGFYIGHDAPETPELAWEADYAAALDRAKKENKPLMVMMTATWCGPCKMLERDTLSNPWIRHFLEPFVVVQAFEVADVEKKYDSHAYPTLAFCDSAGELKFKTVGYQPPINFAAAVAQGIKAVDKELPEELQLLIDKKIVELE